MTALEFYRKHLHALVSTGKTEYKTEPEIFEQAKEMEKEQKQSDYMRGWNDGYQNKVKNPFNDNPKSE